MPCPSYLGLCGIYLDISAREKNSLHKPKSIDLDKDGYLVNSFHFSTETHVVGTQ